MRDIRSSALFLVFSLSSVEALADCSTFNDPISTDRPSTANSSGTVPNGSIQIENGIGVVRYSDLTTSDAPETRLRFGVADYTEILVDLPDFYHSSEDFGPHGASNLGPALKHQFPEWIKGLTFSGTLGVYLDTGNSSISGTGPNPYAQLPWGYDFGSGWSLNGMFSVLEQRHESNTHPIALYTAFLDHTLNDQSDVFVEVVSNTQQDAPTVNTWGIGSSYRFMPQQQIDFKVGSGMNKDAPNFYLTIGYSLRFDHIF